MSVDTAAKIDLDLQMLQDLNESVKLSKDDQLRVLKLLSEVDRIYARRF